MYFPGWMYETRGPGSKVSKATMVWLAAVKLLTLGRKPMLYSYQGSLPRLPLPSVSETMQRVSSTSITCCVTTITI